MATPSITTHRRANPSLIVFLAWRDLRSGPLTAAVLVAAVAVGVAFQVPNTANILGYEAEMLEQGVKSGFGDVRVYPRQGRRIDEAATTLDRLRSTPGVRAVAAVLILPAVVDRHFLASELGDPDATDVLLVYSDEPDRAGTLSARLAGSFPALDARTWAEDSALLRNAIHGSAAVAASSSAMVLVAVALP